MNRPGPEADLAGKVSAKELKLGENRSADRDPFYPKTERPGVITQPCHSS
jgi:hypothetical protein